MHCTFLSNTLCSWLVPVSLLNPGLVGVPQIFSLSTICSESRRIRSCLSLGSKAQPRIWFLLSCQRWSEDASLIEALKLWRPTTSKLQPSHTSFHDILYVWCLYWYFFWGRWWDASGSYGMEINYFLVFLFDRFVRRRFQCWCFH